MQNPSALDDKFLKVEILFICLALSTMVGEKYA